MNFCIYIYLCEVRNYVTKLVLFFHFNFFRDHHSGQLSPENLSKALNQTQYAAADYYSWFHKKVDIYAKIKWYGYLSTAVTAAAAAAAHKFVFTIKRKTMFENMKIS